MTKAERRNCYIQKYINSECTSVEHYYKKCSDLKISIEQSIKRQMSNRNGKRYRVLGGSCYYFICAYVYPKNNTWLLVVETRSNSYKLELFPQELEEINGLDVQKT